MQPSAATVAAKSAVDNYQALGSNDALNTADTQYGVNDSSARLSALKGIVSGLQSSVEAVDPSVTGRTSGTFTTEGQRSALVSKEQAPIVSNLNQQQTAETAQEGDLTQKQTLASQMATALLNDDKAKYQRLLDSYNASTAQDAATEAASEKAAALAEQQREFNAQQAAAAKTTASKSSGGGSSSSSYYTRPSNSGGTSFFDPNGNAITAAQYFNAMGGGVGDLKNFLATDKDKTSQAALAYLNKYGISAAKSKYSYIFGGV